VADQDIPKVQYCVGHDDDAIRGPGPGPDYDGCACRSRASGCLWSRTARR
jgi:hypothetical protein